MKNKLSWQKLGDICQINPSKRDKNWNYPEIEYIDISSVGVGELIERPMLIQINDAPSRAQRLIKEGDTILSTVRPNRRSMLYIKSPKPNTVVSTGFAVLRPKKVNPRFLYYLVFNQDFTKYLESCMDGSAYPAVLPEVIADAKIPILPLPAQQEIAAILGAFDDKIELNRRMNATLESIAQAIFKHMFIDNPEKEGWEEKPLSEIAHFLNGLALQNYPPENGDFLPVIKIAQLHKGNTEGADKASVNIPSDYVVNDGDVLFSWSGSLDLVVWCGGKGALNQHLFKVTSNEYPKWFYYFWIKHYLPDFKEIASGKATTMGHIQRHHLYDAKGLVPSKNEMNSMNIIMSPLLEKIIANNLESNLLASLRNVLLLKLVNGEINLIMEPYEHEF
jgi:type I restriction enzyme S subunit